MALSSQVSAGCSGSGDSDTWDNRSQWLRYGTAWLNFGGNGHRRRIPRV
jgi:hypothetical protein